MAVYNIALLRVLWLKPALQATVTSPEFQELCVFQDIARVVLADSFWVYLFLMCHALYAPLHVLHLADQKVAAIDKLHFFVKQASRIVPKYLLEAEHHSAHLTDSMKTVIEDTTDLASEDVEDNSSDLDDDVVELEEDDDSDNEDEESETEVIYHFISLFQCSGINRHLTFLCSFSHAGTASGLVII